LKNPRAEMLRILYDHQMFSLQKYGGITRYFADLMSNLPEGFSKEIPIRYSENHYLQKLSGVKYERIQCIKNFRIKRQFYYFKNQSLSLKTIKKNEFDLFHPTYYDPSFLKYLKKPFILTIHDMIHERYADMFLFYDKEAKTKKILAHKAQHIIAVSENTKKDIIEFYNIDPAKISVVHHGYDQAKTSFNQLYENYILFIGERSYYKNFIPFIQAVAPLLHKDKQLKVICTGKPFSKKEIDLFISLGINTQLIHCNASDQVLFSLYQHALVFVFPSLYEGFGIPIIEAFANNCPVCLSNTSCFPEVAGEAAIYFDPLDKDSIRTAISSVIYDPIKAEKLRKAGQIRIRQFSIEKMVRETCAIYSQTCL
jgi:glycosyltransferase involved in cell wall biosynthesis